MHRVVMCTLGSVIFLVHRSARSPLQWFYTQFLNAQYLYDMSTPSDPSVCADKTLTIGVATRSESFDKISSIRRSWGAELV
ncbi:hypothetical protein AAVH_08669 [Aphelenchoides avenae]|nr:hypothetical protein AAVH_37602 [Aphelenchus avenae]KAH7723874.1 hypothetical protein AAVH_08669 [Aphelenchus avenae]